MRKRRVGTVGEKRGQLVKKVGTVGEVNGDSW